MLSLVLHHNLIKKISILYAHFLFSLSEFLANVHTKRGTNLLSYDMHDLSHSLGRMSRCAVLFAELQLQLAYIAW